MDHFMRFVRFVRSVMVIIMSCVLVISLAGMAPRVASAADPALHIESDFGYGGYIKHGEWNPLTITLTSNVDLSGEIVVQTEVPGSNTRVSYVERVDLPAGTPKEVSFGILGNSFDKDNSTIQFFKGSVESGKSVKFTSGKGYLQTGTLEDTLIGVLAPDPDSMNFLRTLSTRGQGITVVPLDQKQLPSSETLLSPLDVVVMNNYSTDTLSKEQIAAIRGWVKQGGTLVLAGGPGYPKTVKGLEDLSPVEYTGTADVTQLDELTKAGKKPLSLLQSVPVSTAKLREGAKAAMFAGEIPLFASMPHGKGEAIYTAYDVTTEPLYSWSGHAELWGTVLHKELSLKSNAKAHHSQIDNFMLSVNHLLDYFPSIKMPPFALLLWLLIGYALLVAPALYYVLKKFDKREWAWFIIPIVAVIASGGIYFAGSTGKSSITSHTINVLELDGRGEGERMSASAVFIPRSGNYDLQLEAGTYVTVNREDGLITGGQSAADPGRQLIRVEEDKTTVHLPGMTHRSIVKVGPEQTEETRSYGKLDVKLNYDAKGKPQGTVTNLTSNDLQHAALILGNEIYLLGDLPKSQSLPIPSNFMPSNFGDYGSIVFPFTGNQADYNAAERQRGLINQYMNQIQSTNMIVAWSEDSVSEFKVNGREITSNRINMWIQPLRPEFVSGGKVTIPYGAVLPSIERVTTNEWSQEGGDRVSMGSGEMNLVYELPEDMEVDYSELNIRQTERGHLTVTMIWNESMQQWEELNLDTGVTTITKNIKNYLRPGSTLQIQVKAKDWTGFKLPEIALEGRVKS